MPSPQFWADTRNYVLGSAGTGFILATAIASLIRMDDAAKQGELIGIAAASGAAFGGCCASLVRCVVWILCGDSPEREPLVHQTAPGMGIGASSAV